MAQKSSFFTSLNGDRRYKATDFADYFRTFIGNGVFPNPSTNLTVTTNGDMTVNLSSGPAWINGYMYDNTDDLTLTLSAADGVLARIDRVVIRCDFVNREIKAYIRPGTFSQNPVAPELVRNNDYYELCVAEIRVPGGAASIAQSDITDTRLNSSLCGIVTQMINTIDTSTLFTKLESYIDERGQDVNGWIDEATTRWEVEFISWFNTIKDILDGDIAGALAARIAKLEETVNNLELTSTKVMRPNQKTVEQSLSDNETSISSLNTKTDTTNNTLNTLKTKVDNGQNFKLTNDDGVPINVSSQNIDNYRSTCFLRGQSVTNAPTSDWYDFQVVCDGMWGHQIATAWFSDERYIRRLYSGSWLPWREL